MLMVSSTRQSTAIGLLGTPAALLALIVVSICTWISAILSSCFPTMIRLLLHRWQTGLVIYCGRQTAKVNSLGATRVSPTRHRPRWNPAYTTTLQKHHVPHTSDTL